MATTKLWTVQDIEQLPDDAFRYALIRGVLYRMPPPSFRHGLIVMKVGWHLYSFVTQHNLGLVSDQSGFILERDPDTLLGPDLAFIQRARVPKDDEVYPDLAPDLVVEVVSPSQTGPTVEEKVSIYLDAGVRLVWVVDPERSTVHAHRADGSKQTLSEMDVVTGEDVLPGFQLPVAEIFA